MNDLDRSLNRGLNIRGLLYRVSAVAIIQVTFYDHLNQFWRQNWPSLLACSRLRDSGESANLETECENRLVLSCFSCPRCGLWIGFDEFAVHQGKDEFSPSVVKGFARIDRLPIFQCEKE